MKKRLVFGSLLLAVLCCIIAAGHLWTLFLVRGTALSGRCSHHSDQPRGPPPHTQVLLVQVAMFRELVNVRYSYRRFKDVPLFRTSQWGWFFSCLVYSYGQSFVQPDRSSLLSSRLILHFLPYVEVIALLLYSTMLILTVLTLTKGYYKYQVGQLAWTVAIIVITVVQAHHSACSTAAATLASYHGSGARPASRGPRLGVRTRPMHVLADLSRHCTRVTGALFHSQRSEWTLLVSLPRLARHLQ